jgi:hypothetical protein
MAFISGLIAAAPYIIAGAQMASQVGGAHYANKRMEDQGEENKRAEARAAMISSLTGARAMSQPQIYEASGLEKGFGALGSFSSAASGLLPFMKTPRTLTPTVELGNIQDPGPGFLSGQGRTNFSLPYS